MRMSSVSYMHWFRVNATGQENAIEDSKRTEKKMRIFIFRAIMRVWIKNQKGFTDKILYLIS